MKKVIIEAPRQGILLFNIGKYTPIFAKRDGKLAGMLMCENDNWILRTGGSAGCSGFYETRKECMESAAEFGYEFFVEE